MRSSAALRFPCDPQDDPTFYPEEEHLGEDLIQTLILELLRPLVEAYLEAQGVAAIVGRNQMMYYYQGDPTACVAPDVYVMPGLEVPEAPERIGAWKKWECGVVPSFALEIMSDANKKKKDDRKSPARHDSLGTKELIVFDPYADEIFRRRNRFRFRIFRRNEKDKLLLVNATNEKFVFVESLGCHLRVVGTGQAQRIRIATGPNGEDIFPTRAEAEAKRADAEAKRANDEAQRAEAEAKRANDEAQRANDLAQRANDEAHRANAAEAELERLRTELANLKRQL
jgi:Uma2 family endonuclease